MDELNLDKVIRLQEDLEKRLDIPIDRIKYKLELLKNLDKNFTVFGSSDHKYILNPCLSELEVTNFENKNNITLPNDYREFLINIGNGGAGPYYGIFPLKKYKIHYNEHIWEDSNLAKSYIPFPFPFTDKWIPLEDTNDECDEEEHLKSIYGTMAICHEGCGYCFLLIVNGEEEGNIWFDAMVTNQGMLPLIEKDSNKRYNFFKWYEEWLDNNINKLCQ